MGRGLQEGSVWELAVGFLEHLNHLSCSLLSFFLPYPQAPADNDANTPHLAGTR